jgi:hypothetical protein
MKYVLQIYPNGSTAEVAQLSAEEQQAIIGEYLAIGESPAVIGGAQLQPVETATTVRVQNGETLLTETTDDRLASGSAMPTALTDGFANAFWAGTAIAFVGVLVSIFLVRGRDLRLPEAEDMEPVEPALEEAA